MKNVFYFILKALFVLKVFKFLSWLFGHVKKTTWLERSGIWKEDQGQIPGKIRLILVNKELQHTHCSISHEWKATRQWNLVS